MAGLLALEPLLARSTGGIPTQPDDVCLPMSILMHGELMVTTRSGFALKRLCAPGVRWLRRPRRRAHREVGRVGKGRMGG